MLFKEIGSIIKELLEENFFVSQVVKLKTKTESGVEWRSEGEITEKGIQGNLGVRYQSPIGLSLENLSIRADGRYIADGILKVSDNLKFTMSTEDGRQEPGKPLYSSGKLGFEYINSNIGLSADVDIVNGPIIRCSALYRYLQYHVGSETVLNSHFEDKGVSPDIIGLNIGALYRGNDWESFIRATDILSCLQCGYVHHVSPNIDVCGQLDYRLKSNAQKIVVGSRLKYS